MIDSLDCLCVAYIRKKKKVKKKEQKELHEEE